MQTSSLFSLTCSPHWPSVCWPPTQVRRGWALNCWWAPPWEPQREEPGSGVWWKPRWCCSRSPGLRQGWSESGRWRRGGWWHSPTTSGSSAWTPGRAYCRKRAPPLRSKGQRWTAAAQQWCLKSGEGGPKNAEDVKWAGNRKVERMRQITLWC